MGKSYRQRRCEDVERYVCYKNMFLTQKSIVLVVQALVLYHLDYYPLMLKCSKEKPSKAAAGSKQQPIHKMHASLSWGQGS